jgi:transcriptional regulator with XRE-family HTH domain
MSRTATQSRRVTAPAPEPEVDYLAVNNREAVKAIFAQRLYELIAKKGWTQSEFARYAKLNRDAVSTYIRSKSMPTPLNLTKMADCLGVKPDALVPNYYDSDVSGKGEPTVEIKAMPGEDGFMWVRVNMRMPKKEAMQVFALAQPHA